MQLSRDARNKMRLLGLSRDEVRLLLADPVETRQDHQGNPMVTGVVEGRSVFVVVVAADDPGLIITVYEKRAR